MAEKITVPALGESVTEATVSKWLKAQGENVIIDEPIVELETDKVNVEVPAPTNGVLPDYSFANAKDTSGTNADASWWFKFTNDGNTYTVQYRKLDYIFESEAQNKFHYDVEEKIYDYTTGKTVKDTVKILSTNSILSTSNSIGYPLTWQVVDVVTETDGFRDNRKVKVGFFDNDDDGVVELVEESVAPLWFHDRVGLADEHDGWLLGDSVWGRGGNAQIRIDDIFGGGSG